MHLSQVIYSEDHTWERVPVDRIKPQIVEQSLDPLKDVIMQELQEALNISVVDTVHELWSKLRLTLAQEIRDEVRNEVMQSLKTNTAPSVPSPLCDTSCVQCQKPTLKQKHTCARGSRASK